VTQANVMSFHFQLIVAAGRRFNVTSYLQ